LLGRGSRGAKVARRLGRASLAADWERWADAYREIILERAYNKELGFFHAVLDGRFPMLPTCYCRHSASSTRATLGSSRRSMPTNDSWWTTG
jgi:hypothetical protein